MLVLWKAFMITGAKHFLNSKNLRNIFYKWIVLVKFFGRNIYTVNLWLIANNLTSLLDQHG